MESRPLEVTAPDVEKAIERGLAQLGLSKQQVQVQVIDPGSRGILGIGARDAVVCLTPVTPMAEPAIAEGKPDPLPESLAETESRPIVDMDQDDEPSEPDESDYDLSQDQVAKIAQQTLGELLDKMGIECQVAIRPPDRSDPEPAPVTLDVSGEDAETLIGRHGEVLSALQYVTRLIVSREVEHWVNMVVDVHHYKQRRARSLQQLAERIADRVARTQQPVALEPMPPNERRVIHVALVDHPSVTTQSVGKGEERRVTIIPKR